MIIDIINEFRQSNGKERIFTWNMVENDYCLQHCLYMAKIVRLEHTPEYFLHGKAEAVVSCSFQENLETTIRFLIFRCIGFSSGHRDIVLNYNNLAYGFYINHYMAYLTIRGW